MPVAISDCCRHDAVKGRTGFTQKKKSGKFVQLGAFWCNEKYKFLKLIFNINFIGFQLLFTDFSSIFQANIKFNDFSSPELNLI